MKQAVIRRALALRREVPELFARGEYRPMDVTGARAEHVVAFLRSHEARHCLVVVLGCRSGYLPRRILFIFPEAAWQDTTLHPPTELEGTSCATRWRQHRRTRQGPAD